MGKMKCSVESVQGNADSKHMSTAFFEVKSSNFTENLTSGFRSSPTRVGDFGESLRSGFRFKTRESLSVMHKLQISYGKTSPQS